MTTDPLLFARVVARVAYYIINKTKCATAACCITRAPDADDVVNLAALLLLHTTYGALIHAIASRAEPSLEVDNRLLTINRLLRDFFLKVDQLRQSLDL
jgi:hypothetical protein